MEFSSDEKIRAISALTSALFKHVLDEEEPFFIGDEATILDVSLCPPEEIQKRCSAYYNTAVSLEELRRPLWQLLPELERRRQTPN